MRNAVTRFLVWLALFLVLGTCTLETDTGGDDDYTVPLPSFGIGFVEAGDANLLYIGKILTPAGIITGEMLVDASGHILYIGRDSSAHAKAATATRLVCAYGLAVPGLIDAWRHLNYAGNLPADTAGERYDHRHQWRTGSGGHTEITVTSTNLPRLDEIALIISGTASVTGSASGTVAGMVRNLAGSGASEGLLQVSESVSLDSFPLGDSAGFMTTAPTAYPSYPDDPDTQAYTAYAAIVAEGINAEARCEFLAVSDSGAGTADILSSKTSIVHGAGLLPQDVQKMAAASSTLVWTPRSDLYLYGNTAPVTAAARLGCNIALASTWTVTGSPNLLEELKTARFFNRQYLDGFFSDKELLEMATRNAARAYHVDDRVGTLEPGKLADFVVFDTRLHADYEAVFAAKLVDVAVVFRGGSALYGDTYLVDAIRGTETGSEILSVAGAEKRIFTVEQFGVTLDDLSETGFFPIIYSAADIVTDVIPSRPGEYTGTPTTLDRDGDGIENSLDNAPDVFNPPRPVDGGIQGDQDSDGIGDLADPTPLG